MTANDYCRCSALKAAVRANIDLDQGQVQEIVQNLSMTFFAPPKDMLRNLSHHAVRLIAAGAVATSVALVYIGLTPTLAASSQELLTPSDWLDKLDRDHKKLVSPAGHVHARGRVQAVDLERPGSITILVDAIESPDKTIRMPAMEMPFHVTNRRMLQGIRAGDVVDFEAARLKNAVMITKIRKAD